MEMEEEQEKAKGRERWKEGYGRREKGRVVRKKESKREGEINGEGEGGMETDIRVAFAHPIKALFMIFCGLLHCCCITATHCTSLTSAKDTARGCNYQLATLWKQGAEAVKSHPHTMLVNRGKRREQDFAFSGGAVCNETTITQPTKPCRKTPDCYRHVRGRSSVGFYACLWVKR